MKNSTKIVIFLIVAFIIVIAITFSARSAEAPTSPAMTQTSTTIQQTSTPAPTTYSLADVAKHKTSTDCWTAVSGGVYNLTPFVNQHPGGVENIIKLCGIDGTALFTAQHGGQKNPERELASLKIGTLAN